MGVVLLSVAQYSDSLKNCHHERSEGSAFRPFRRKADSSCTKLGLLVMTTTQTKDLAERYCKVVIPVSTCPSRSVARNDNSEGGGPLRLSACHYNPQFSIVEGQGRLGAAEFRHFLPQARGSLMELETQVLIAERLCYVRPEPAREILLQAAELGRVLNGLLNSLSTGN